MNKPNILNNQGYFNRHLQLCKECETQQDAYDKLEEEYLELTGRNRHKSYDAFRAAKTRYFQVCR
jgi:hypothetical protein